MLNSSKLLYLSSQLHCTVQMVMRQNHCSSVCNLDNISSVPFILFGRTWKGVIFKVTQSVWFSIELSCHHCFLEWALLSIILSEVRETVSLFPTWVKETGLLLTAHTFGNILSGQHCVSPPLVIINTNCVLKILNIWCASICISYSLNN